MSHGDVSLWVGAFIGDRVELFVLHRGFHLNICGLSTGVGGLQIIPSRMSPLVPSVFKFTGQVKGFLTLSLKIFSFIY